MSGSGGINSSIPLQAGQGITQPINPLATYGQYQQLQAGRNQLQQQQNELSMFPGQQQLQQQAVQGGALGLAQKTNQAAYSMLAPYLADPSMTHDKLTTALAGIEAAGIPTGGVIADFQKSLPGGDGPGFNQAFRTTVGARMLTDPNAQLQAVAGAPTSINTGPAIQPGMTGGILSRQPGAFSPSGGAVQLGLSPEGATTPTQVGITPQGAPIMGTRQQFINNTGGQPLGTGRLPTALLNPNRPGVAAPGSIGAGSPGYAPAQTDAAPAPGASGGVVTGLGPAQATALTQQGGESQKAFQAIADQGVQAQSQNAVLGNMLGDAAHFASGQTDLNAVKAQIQKYAPSLAASLGVSPQSVAANESFDKLANQIAGAQGAGSDARLAVAQGANPSSHLSPQGVDLVVRQLQGNADFLQARAKLAAAYPDQSDRAGFESKIGAQIDPRAFQFDRMTPQQRVTYAQSLSPTDQKKVQTAYVKAGQLGLLSSGWTPNGQ